MDGFEFRAFVKKKFFDTDTILQPFSSFVTRSFLPFTARPNPFKFQVLQSILHFTCLRPRSSTSNAFLHSISESSTSSNARVELRAGKLPARSAGSLSARSEYYKTTPPPPTPPPPPSPRPTYFKFRPRPRVRGRPQRGARVSLVNSRLNPRLDSSRP